MWLYTIIGINFWNYAIWFDNRQWYPIANQSLDGSSIATALIKKRKRSVCHLLHGSTISGNKTTKLSFAYTIISATEAHNHSSVARALHDGRKKYAPSNFHLVGHVPRSWKYLANVNKYEIAERQLNYKIVFHYVREIHQWDDRANGKRKR